jgi:peptidoglycan/LPS O-acetylase OafA/YrhL
MQRVKERDAIRGPAAFSIVVYHLSSARIGLLGSVIDLFKVGVSLAIAALSDRFAERPLLPMEHLSPSPAPEARSEGRVARGWMPRAVPEEG